MRRKDPWFPPGLNPRTLKFQWSEAKIDRSDSVSSRRLAAKRFKTGQSWRSAMANSWGIEGGSGRWKYSYSPMIPFE